MIKKTITFTDYNGKERTEDFYFHLSKAELVEMELSTKEGLAENLQKLVKSQDGGKIIRTFKDLVFKAYGEKTADGRSFQKSKKISRGFAQTEAYSNLFMLLATDADEAVRFIRGIMPADLVEEAEKSEARKVTTKQDMVEKLRDGKALTGTSDEIARTMFRKANPPISDVDLENMSREDLIRFAATSQARPTAE